jgi:cephalosporin hydroxylase
MSIPDKVKSLIDYYSHLVLPVHPRVLEIGVQYGGSLELWKRLWPDAIVIGVDVNPESVWPDGTVRIVADQSDPTLPHRIMTASGLGLFDLIVDDASHKIEATRATWSRLWPFVTGGGVYVWEDWQVGVTHPEHFGSVDTLLGLMAAEVSAGRASSLRVKRDFVILVKE